MIGKRIDRRAGGSDFGDLIRYVSQGPKASAVATNRLSGPRMAPAVMRTTAAAARARDPVVHWVISWRPDERPSDRTALSCAFQLMDALGFGQHQFLAAVHRDADQVHVHTAVNAVHPVHRTLHRPQGDYLVADRVMRALELQHGFAHDRGRFRVDADGAIVDNGPSPDRGDPVAHGAKGVETVTGRRSTQRRVLANPRVADALRSARSWADLHARLGAHGLRLAPVARGPRPGLVLVDANDGRAIAAPSAVARDAGRPALERRLGPFVHNGDTVDDLADGQTRPRSSADAGRSDRAGRTTEAMRALKAAQQAERHSLLADPDLPGLAKMALEKVFAEERRAERRALRERLAAASPASTAVDGPVDPPLPPTVEASDAARQREDANLVPVLVADGWVPVDAGDDPVRWTRDGVLLVLTYDAPGVARFYANPADANDAGGIEAYTARHRAAAMPAPAGPPPDAAVSSPGSAAIDPDPRRPTSP
jgi:hypothetical protein